MDISPALAGPRRKGLAALGVLGACLVCTLLTLWCVRAAPILYYEDAVHYLSLGTQLAAGSGYHSATLRFPDLMQPPLYPLLIALGVRLGGNPVGAAVALCIAAHLLTIVALVRLHELLWGRRGRLITAAVAAVYPNIAFGAALVLEPLFLCLVAWALYLAISAVRRGSTKRAAACGLLLGLALLVRSEVVITAPGVAALLLLSRAPWRRRLSWLSAMAGALLLVAVPYGLWMRSQIGTFEVLPKVRYNLVQADITTHMAWEPGEEGLSGREQRTFFTLMPDHATFVMNHAFSHPGFDARQMLPRRSGPGAGQLLRQLASSIRAVAIDGILFTGAFHPVALLLLLLGGHRGLRGVEADAGGPGERKLLTGFLFVLLLLHIGPALAAGADYGSRFLAPSLLLSVPLVAGGALALADHLARRWPSLRHEAVAAGVCGVLVAGYDVGSVRVIRVSTGGPRVMARSAALEEACARHVPLRARVLAEHGRYAFLRQGAAFQLPYVRSMDELTDYIAHHRIEFALFDGRTLRRNPSRIARGLADRRGWPLGWSPLEVLFEGDDPIWLVRLR